MIINIFANYLHILTNKTNAYTNYQQMFLHYQTKNTFVKDLFILAHLSEEEALHLDLVVSSTCTMLF